MYDQFMNDCAKKNNLTANEFSFFMHKQKKKQFSEIRIQRKN